MIKKPSKTTPNHHKQTQVGLWLKPEEIALVKEASKRSKVTTSHFIRRSAVSYA